MTEDPQCLQYTNVWNVRVVLRCGEVLETKVTKRSIWKHDMRIEGINLNDALYEVEDCSGATLISVLTSEVAGVQIDLVSQDEAMIPNPFYKPEVDA